MATFVDGREQIICAAPQSNLSLRRRVEYVARRSGSNASQRKSSPLGSLDPAERAVVLDRLLIAHPELHGDAERLATDLLAAVSVEQAASEVEAALVWISLDALAARSGRVLGRG